MNDEYLVITPFGVVSVTFGEDEDSNAYYHGDENIIFWLKEQIRRCTNGDGITINPDTVTPLDLFGFCQSDKVVVIPSFS